MAYIGKSPTGTGVRSRYYYTATGGETSLSGADDNSNTLVFSDGNYVDVSLNGIALVAGTDYNTSTANTIGGLSALSASDIVEVVVYDIFTVADTVSAKDGGTFSGNVAMGGTLSVTGASTATGGLNVGTIKEATGTTTAITIDSSGNVDINGNDFILDADGDSKIVASTDDLIEFYTANTQHMTIDASGNTTIRTGGSVYANVSMGYAGLTQVGLAMNDTDSTGSTQAIIFRKNGSQIGAIVNTTSAVSYNSSSDYRLKENVTGITDATSRLKQLNPVRFNFIADADNTVDGFLAHEVQTVVPEAITGTHNEVDDDGNPVYQAIDQSKLVPLLVKTIQELEARITALENV